MLKRLSLPCYDTAMFLKETRLTIFKLLQYIQLDYRVKPESDIKLLCLNEQNPGCPGFCRSLSWTKGESFISFISWLEYTSFQFLCQQFLKKFFNFFYSLLMAIFFSVESSLRPISIERMPFLNVAFTLLESMSFGKVNERLNWLCRVVRSRKM